MFDFVLAYVETAFSGELQDEITKSFSLMEAFEYQDTTEGIIDVLMDADNRSTDDVQDLFIKKIHEKLDYLLEQHKVYLQEETEIPEKNEILTGLQRVQYLEDYLGVSQALDAMFSNEEVFARVMSEVTSYDESRIISLTLSIHDDFIEMLRELADSKEEEEETPIPMHIVKNIRLFAKIFGEESVGVQIVKDGVALGMKFETYLPYVEDILINASPELTADNIFSILLISEEGNERIHETFKEHSLELLKDLNVVARVETALIKKIGLFNEHKAALGQAEKVSE